MFEKKSIVLRSVENDERKAILTLEKLNGEVKGSLRLYNFASEPLGIISLGIHHDGKVEKAGLTRKEGMLYSFGSGLNNIPKTFSCAVVNIFNGQSQPILFGNSEGQTARDALFDQVISGLGRASTVEDVEKILDENNINYEDDLQEEIDSEIDKAMGCCEGACENCEYKKYYLEHQKASSLSLDENDKMNEEIEEEEKKENTFYNEIKKQIDKLFEENPTEQYLENMLPNSKWVKVSVDDEGNFYVLGLIYEEEELKYICYGVPGVYQPSPPRQLSGFPVWFALDNDNPQGFGYWLSYQDAQTGESVKAVLV